MTQILTSCLLGEAPPPSRPSSTQVEFVPASATQTLIATASALSGLATTPVLVNNYHKEEGGTPSANLSISSSTPVATRKLSSPPSPTVRPPNNRTNFQSNSGAVTTRHTRSVSDSSNKNNGSNSPTTDSPKKARRVVPPIFEGDSGEWQLRTRQVRNPKPQGKSNTHITGPGEGQYRSGP